MESLSSLHLLTEAVRDAGADIAPTYQEYIQLAFAIATDCGEVGRQDFLTLCSLSPKYDRRAADKLFSNALRNGRNNVHLGTAFHLAELCGVKLRSDVPSDTYTTFAQKDTASQKGAGAKVQPSPHTHTRVRVRRKKIPKCRAATRASRCPPSTGTPAGLIPWRRF